MTKKQKQPITKKQKYPMPKKERYIKLLEFVKSQCAFDYTHAELEEFLWPPLYEINTPEQATEATSKFQLACKAISARKLLREIGEL